MIKRMMLLVLSVVSALFALPAVASATPAHVSEAANFTVSPGATEQKVRLKTTGAENFECHNGVTGAGSWISTTTGSLSLVFHGCTVPTMFGHVPCTSSGQPDGTIETTVLPFHLVMIADHSPGVLLTPGLDAEGKPHFTTFTCGGLVRKATGNGLLGTITSPTCGVANTTATLKFEQGGTGLQKHTTYTGSDHHWLFNGLKTALMAEARIHFATAKAVTCT